MPPTARKLALDHNLVGRVQWRTSIGNFGGALEEHMILNITQPRFLHGWIWVLGPPREQIKLKGCREATEEDRSVVG